MAFKRSMRVAWCCVFVACGQMSVEPDAAVTGGGSASSGGGVSSTGGGTSTAGGASGVGGGATGVGGGTSGVGGGTTGVGGGITSTTTSVRLEAMPQYVAPGGASYLVGTVSTDAGTISCVWSGPGTFSRACSPSYFMGQPSIGDPWTAPDAGFGPLRIGLEIRSAQGTTVLAQAETIIEVRVPFSSFVVAPNVRAVAAALSATDELYLASLENRRLRITIVRDGGVFDGGLNIANTDVRGIGSMTFLDGDAALSADAESSNIGPMVMRLINGTWVRLPGARSWTYSSPQLMPAVDGGLYAAWRNNVINNPLAGSVEVDRYTPDAGWSAVSVSTSPGTQTVLRASGPKLSLWQGAPLLLATTGPTTKALWFSERVTETDETGGDGWENLGTAITTPVMLGTIRVTRDPQGRPVTALLGGGFDSTVSVYRYDGTWTSLGTSLFTRGPTAADIASQPDGGLTLAVQYRREGQNDATVLLRHTNDLTETDETPGDGWKQIGLPINGTDPKLLVSSTGELWLVIATVQGTEVFRIE